MRDTMFLLGCALLGFICGIAGGIPGALVAAGLVIPVALILTELEMRQ